MPRVGLQTLLTIVGFGLIAQAQPNQAKKINILFIGNSHTHFHDLPNLVARMIEFGQSGLKVHVESIGISFLEELKDHEVAAKTLAGRDWDIVVLQAQKISMSGRYHYSQQEGIDFARKAREHGARVLFFSEWGRKDVPGDGQAVEKIYLEMAAAAGAEVAPIGQAWDLALAKRPELALHADDGNHESATGAFLTACTFAGLVSDLDPAVLGKFDFAAVNKKDREFLALSASITVNQQRLASPNPG